MSFDVNALLSKATTDRDEVKKSALRMIKSEMDRMTNPKQKEAKITDDQVFNIVKKMITDNKEMLKYLVNPDTGSFDKAEKVIKENEYLETLIPKELTKEEIIAELVKIKDKLVGLMDGQCMATCMGHFRGLNLKVSGSLVKECMEIVRK